MAGGIPSWHCAARGVYQDITREEATPWLKSIPCIAPV
jgi:hypothetical protein